MVISRRVARVVVWVGLAALLLAAAVSLAQGSSPTDFDLQPVYNTVANHLPDANQLSQLQDRIGQDLHAAADAVDPYWHAAADAVDPYWHAAVDAADPYIKAADPYIKTAADNIKNAAEVVDPYLHSAMDAAGGVVRQGLEAGLEVMKPYVDDEMYEMVASATRSPWGMGEDADGEGGEGEGAAAAAEEERGGGGGGGGGFEDSEQSSRTPEGESTLGQWVGREAEKPAVTAADEASSSSSSSDEEEQQQRKQSELLNINFHDVGALAMSMPAALPKPKPPKPASAAASAPPGRKCARAFTDARCKNVVKLPECAGNPYRGKFWTVSKAAVKADPGNRFFKGLSSAVVNSLPPTSPFDGEPFESCALVSSGRDMLKKKQGALIDSHAVVMRINGGVVQVEFSLPIA
jgi:hypothetical protein